MVTAKKIDFISFERLGLKITLSVSEKKLKEQVNNIVERVATDLKAIEIQENKEEILVEYKKSLNVSEAVSIVDARHKAIQAEKERKAKQAEQRARELAAAKAVEDAARQQEQIQQVHMQQENNNSEPIQETQLTPPTVKLKKYPFNFYAYIEASSKEEAIEILRDFKPELIEFMEDRGVHYGK